MSGFSAVTYALARKAAKTYTDNLFSKVEGISIAFVDALPTKDISTKTIYFVPHSSDPGDYSYDEYMYVDNAWKLIGSTELHLEDYYTKEELKKDLVNILPIATTTSLGAVMIDDNAIKISETGVITVSKDFILSVIDENLIPDEEIDKIFF